MGAGRSFDKFDITSAVGKCKEFIEKFGGHKQAVGLTIKKKYRIIKIIKKITDDELKEISITQI